MAKRYHKPLKIRIKDAFGRINKVDVLGINDEHIASLRDDEDFTNFYNNENFRNNISDFRYVVEPKNTANINNVESTKKAFKSVAKSYFKTNNVNVDVGGKALDLYGDRLYKPSTSSTRFLQGLDENKSEIVSNTPNTKLIDIARRKDAAQFYKILDESGLSEYSTVSEKADAIRSFIRKRNMTRSKNSKLDLFASSVVWDASKDTVWQKSLERDFGKNAFRDINKTLGRDKSTEYDANKIMQKQIRKKWGGKNEFSRKIFNEIKSEFGFRTDVETMEFLDSDDGRRAYRDKLAEKVYDNEIKPKKANSIIKKQNLGRALELEAQNIGKRKISDTEQKTLVGNALLDYSSTSPNTMSKFLWEKLKENPEALEALATNNYDAVRQLKPSSVDFNELHAFYGKTPKKQHLKRLVEHGIDITGAPADIQDYLAGTVTKPYTDRGRGESKGSNSSSYSSSSGSSSSRRGRTITSTGGSLLGTEKIKYIKGEAHVVKEKGRIASALYGAGGKIKSRLAPKKKDYESIYRKLNDRDDLKYLTEEEKRYASRANVATRQNIIRKGRKMYLDPAYRAKQGAKKEERKGIYEAKLLKAHKMSQRRAKAATSPWWNVWYSLTRNIWVLIGIFLILALLFLPIGMFYVLGWAIAVGVVSLVMFVIWVFIEIWWMIAQVITSFINLVGQAIIGVANYVGAAITGALGQEFTPFSHQLVQNMNLVERDPLTGERKILGITWGEWNLVPPDFLKLNEFMPRKFDSDVLIVKAWPALRDFFKWYTEPIGQRYTEWISHAEWYYVGAIIGVPIVLIIIGIVVAALYFRRKMI